MNRGKMEKNAAVVHVLCHLLGLMVIFTVIIGIITPYFNGKSVKMNVISQTVVSDITHNDLFPCSLVTG